MATFGRLQTLVKSYHGICSKCIYGNVSQTFVRFNSNRAAIARPNRNCYARTYQTAMVLPDGATISVRYKEPCRIIKLPLDLNTVSEEERQRRLLRRKPKHKIIIHEDIEDSFDVNRYSHLWKK